MPSSRAVQVRRPSLEVPQRSLAWAENERRPDQLDAPLAVNEVNSRISLHSASSTSSRSRLAASVTSFGANAKAAGVAGTAGAAGSAGGVAKEAKEAESGKAKENVPSVLRERKAAMEQEARRIAAFEEAKRAEEQNLGTKAQEVMKAMKLDFMTLDHSRQVLHRWISWSGFDSAVGIVIIANAVTIGLETHYALQIPSGCNPECRCADSSATCQGMPLWLVYIDYVFFGIYVIEFLLRFYTYGRPVFKSNWIKFDLFLVCSSAVDLVMQVVQLNSELLDQIILVRILRLARLARAVRLMVQFQTLWQLVQGLMLSLTTLLWTFLLIMILMYIFAILGMELITIDGALPSESPYNVAARENFRSFQDAILTLLQVFSLDSIGSVYRPLVNQRMFLFFYFITAMLVLAIALMNLVTAVMVNTSLDQASQDKEAKQAWEAAKRKKQVEHLRRMFASLDEDGSGELSLEELLEAPEDLICDLKEISTVDDLEELFSMLDYDGGGAIDTNEFCEGILKVANESRSAVELGRLMKQCNEILSNTNMLMDFVKAPVDKVKGRRSRIDAHDRPSAGLHERVGKLENEVAAMHEDLKTVIRRLEG